MIQPMKSIPKDATPSTSVMWRVKFLKNAVDDYHEDDSTDDDVDVDGNFNDALETFLD